MFSLKLIFALFTITYGATAAQLPSFITKCDKESPNFGECAMKAAHQVIPKLRNGYRDLNLPPISPFHVSEIGIEATESLTLKLTDVDIFGLMSANFTSTSCDFGAMECKATIFFPKLEVKGTYDIDGQIMILPIKGHGSTNITIVEALFTTGLKWTLLTRNNTVYAHAEKLDIQYETKRSYYKFENLFNGDKALGDQMNEFLNENWEDLSHEVEPAVSRTISVILLSIISNLVDIIPYNDLFA